MSAMTYSCVVRVDLCSSAPISTAYVMCKTGLGHDDAFTFVQNRRFCVAPRVEFQHQIEVSSRALFGQSGTDESYLNASGLWSDLSGAPVYRQRRRRTEWSARTSTWTRF